MTPTVPAEGADLGTHHAVAPMTLQVLEGRLRYRMDGEDFGLGAGKFLFLRPRPR